MTRTPCSNSVCASGFALGSATGVIGWAAAPELAAWEWQPAAASVARESARASRRSLVTADLLDALEQDAGLADADPGAHLGLLRVLVLGEPRERLADLLGVLVVDADLEGARVARLVRVDRLVLDDDDHLLELVP